MNELTINQTELTLDSREIAIMMGITHDRILRKLEGGSDRKGYIQILADSQMGVTDYFVKSSYTTDQNKEMPCYKFTKMGCEFIANKFTGESGVLFTAKYVKRFNEMQTGIQYSYMISDPIERAKAWIKEQEQKQLLEQKIEADKPKVLFADAVSSSKTSILIGELAKILRQNGIEIGQNRLFEELRNKGYLIKRAGSDWNMPTQRSMELGLFEIKEHTHIDGNGCNVTTKTAKVTGKGQQYFINKFLTA